MGVGKYEMFHKTSVLLYVPVQYVGLGGSHALWHISSDFSVSIVKESFLIKTRTKNKEP